MLLKLNYIHCGENYDLGLLKINSYINSLILRGQNIYSKNIDFYNRMIYFF